MAINKKAKQKNDFEPFKIGTIFNPTIVDKSLIKSKPYSYIKIKYPSRLEAMAIDPSKIVENDNLVYTPGQIDFTISLFKTISIDIDFDSDEIIVTERSKRKPLIMHSAEIMRSAIGFNYGLRIDVEDTIDLRHCGLGSSSGLIAGIATAINELFDNPISAKNLVRYLAQNHGEEIEGDDQNINPVQCIGGSAACGTHEGGIVIIAGRNTVVKTANVSEEYDVVIGVPKDFTHPDSKYLMEKEIENLPKFLECGETYGSTIAYRLFHDCLPALEDNEIKPLGDLIYDYRFNMGSIKNCSFVFPPILERSDKLRFLKGKYSP